MHNIDNKQLTMATITETKSLPSSVSSDSLPVTVEDLTADFFTRALAKKVSSV